MEGYSENVRIVCNGTKQMYGNTAAASCVAVAFKYCDNLATEATEGGLRLASNDENRAHELDSRLTWAKVGCAGSEGR